MKAFYAILFLALIGMAFAKDIFKQDECPAVPDECKGLISLVGDLLAFLAWVLGTTLGELCLDDEVGPGLCSIGLCIP
ncbi:hypothetical protein ALC62_12315 [Cyphomyrmex costatus]|uniref:Uncharacterized protein n=1 Tax=Cyphomyrmex costatus TaxID=456900 RepID=A0A151IBM5_9HYME|nr:hypothetical protein ALC62_12315 [Cyphomyrmex costatus]